MDTWVDFLETRLNLEAEVISNLLITLLIFVVMWLARRGFLRPSYRRSDYIPVQYVRPQKEGRGDA